MAELTTAYPTIAAWSAGARLTAAVATPILVTNPDKKAWLYGAITDDLTAPTAIDPVDGLGIVVKQGKNFAMTLAAGQTLWLARSSGTGFAVVTV
jgi:hypothetical protein